MDQRGRPELRLPAIDRPAGRGVRRRHVLRDVQRGTASEDGRARVRRPRVPARRRRARAPSSSGPSARRTRAGPTPPRYLGAEPVPRDVRARARGAGPARRAARRTTRSGHATAAQVRSLLAGAAHEPEFARPNDPAVASAPQTWDADARSGLRLLRRVGVVDPSSIDDYRAHGGYEALRRAHALGAGGHDPRGHGRQADGPRRRGVPDRGEVEGGRGAARAAALLHLQRRRIRARDVQGPGRDGAGSVRGDRGAHDRRVRHGVRAGLHLHPRRVPAGDRPPRRTRSPRRAGTGSSATT